MAGQQLAVTQALYFGGVTLADRINVWLEATGKKKNAVAGKGGVKPSQISEILNEDDPTDPRFSTVEKIAAGFGVTLEAFFIGPRPEGEAGRDTTPGERNPIFTEKLQRLDVTTPAPDTWQGDVLKAQSAIEDAHLALNRALRRTPDTGKPVAAVKKAGR